MQGHRFKHPQSTTATAMGDHDISQEKAAACRQTAKNDTARAECRIDRATGRLQRAAHTAREAVTYEIHHGRMVPKSAK